MPVPVAGVFLSAERGDVCQGQGQSVGDSQEVLFHLVERKCTIYSDLQVAGFIGVFDYRGCFGHGWGVRSEDQTHAGMTLAKAQSPI